MDVCFWNELRIILLVPHSRNDQKQSKLVINNNNNCIKGPLKENKEIKLLYII